MNPQKSISSFWLFVYIVLNVFVNVADAQDWLGAYSSLFGGFNGYATQGPQTGWDSNQYNVQNQPVVDTQNQGIIDQNTQANLLPPPNQGVIEASPQTGGLPTHSHAGIVNTNPQGGLLPPESQFGTMDSNAQTVQVQNPGVIDVNSPTGVLQPQNEVSVINSNIQPEQNQGMTGIANQLNHSPPNMASIDAANQGQFNQPDLNQGNTQPALALADPPGQYLNDHSVLAVAPAVPPAVHTPPTSPPPPEVSVANTAPQWIPNVQVPDSQTPAGDQGSWHIPATASPLLSPEQWQQGLSGKSDPSPASNANGNMAPTFKHPPTLIENNGAMPTHTNDYQRIHPNQQNHQGHIASSAINHYHMPPNGQMQAWPAAPYGTYPTHPHTKAEMIRYLREAALRFYGQYPTYPQAHWNQQNMQQAGTSVPSGQSAKWTSQTNSSDMTDKVVSTQTPAIYHSNQQVSETTSNGPSHPVDSSQFFSIINPEDSSKTLSTMSEQGVENTTVTTTPANTMVINITDSPESGPSKQDNFPQLETLTPHKNMTNAELHKIIRILLIPHKLKQLTKAKSQRKKWKSKHPSNAPSVSIRKTVSPPQPPSIGGYTRRPVSEMHIKMVNFAPHPRVGVPGTGGLPTLSGIQHQPSSEIHVKLINYDQKIVDTFKSHISSPYSPRSKWVSSTRPGLSKQMPQQKKIPKIQPVLNTSKKRVTFANPKRFPATKDRHKTQEDVRNHQKAVVRHTQMLHHVMGSLKNELNRFQGSVRHSRTLVPSENTQSVPNKVSTTVNSTRLKTPLQLNIVPPLNTSLLNVSISKPSPSKQGEEDISFKEVATNKPELITLKSLVNAKVNRSSILGGSTKVEPPSVPNIHGILKMDRDIKSDAIVTSTIPPPTTQVETTAAVSTGGTSTPSYYQLYRHKFQSELMQVQIKNIKEPLPDTKSETKENQNKNINETSYKISDSKSSTIKIAPLYSLLNKALENRNKNISNGTNEQVTSLQGMAVAATTLLTVQTESVSSTPVPESTTFVGTTISVTDLPAESVTDVNQDLTNQQLNDKLVEQLSVLEKLHHRQKLVNQQQQLKEQHTRLKKQRDLLQQQLKTLQKLRGGNQESPLPVPEGPAGLAALWKNFQMTL